MPNNNSSMRFCPNCGQQVKSGFTHCPNCGYDLVHHHMPHSRVQRPFRPQPQRRPRPNQMRPTPPARRRGNGPLIAIIILVLIICIGGGYYYYKNDIATPQTSTSTQSNSTNNSNSNSSSSNVISKSDATSLMNNMWSSIEDVATNNNSNGSLANYFQDGDNNNDYHVVHGWAKDMSKSDSLEGLKVTPHVKSIKADGSDSDVTYQVDYVFHYEGNTKRQGFIWHAKLTKANGNWKVVTNKADNSHPVYND